MMAAGVILRNWRAGLLGALLLGLVFLIILALVNERPSPGELPLRGVPDSAYASAGVELYPAYQDIVARENVAFGPKGAEFLAGQMICCGKPDQTVLVGLSQPDGDSSILSYALNYDTSKAPKDPPFGGHWTTAFTRESDYFVAFLDATTGKLIYRLQPGYDDPFPSGDEPTGYAAAPIVARNLDGPNVFVTLWTGGPETTVVECGEEEFVASTQTFGGPWYVSVNDASSGNLLFERHLPADGKWILTVRHDGIVIGDEMVSSGPFRPNNPCQ